ncbi:helix-turn-helix domain-containing protein [Agrobacterium sp. a22-2]|uniref:helix-turn-helix domain-containing protein n=1 Tax=Agrobacterium sp. a22-2 TaxID=2283840 RepID=UPI0014484B4F|nr:helix-turn-helix domain-containing protein [Agrobacterium sp. a22-2]NKN39014.1 helix-turn-helix domain-containing protein [Agrobacterium sp. a22-2]
MRASSSIAPSNFRAPRALLAKTFTRPRPVAMLTPDTEIYAQGEASGVLYRIEFGAVKIYRLMADGRRQVIAFHFAGETFGFECGQVRSFFAECIVATGLTTVDMDDDGRFPADLMELALKEMVRAQEHLLVVGKQSAIEKLSVFLVDLVERQGGLDSVDIPMTRTDIGDYLGMTIETVSRSLSRLKSEGILRLRSNRSIEILSPNRLSRLASKPWIS